MRCDLRMRQRNMLIVVLETRKETIEFALERKTGTFPTLNPFDMFLSLLFSISLSLSLSFSHLFSLSSFPLYSQLGSFFYSIVFSILFLSFSSSFLLFLSLFIYFLLAFDSSL